MVREELTGLLLPVIWLPASYIWYNDVFCALDGDRLEKRNHQVKGRFH